jgi:hypothetical protein
MSELKEGVVPNPVFEIEVNGLGKVQFFKDDEKNCCWFTVYRENDLSGWAYAKPKLNSRYGEVEYGAVNTAPMSIL